MTDYVMVEREWLEALEVDDCDICPINNRCHDAGACRVTRNLHRDEFVHTLPPSAQFAERMEEDLRKQLEAAREMMKELLSEAERMDYQLEGEFSVGKWDQPDIFGTVTKFLAETELK